MTSTIQHTRYLVFGMARSGRAAAQLLLAHGKDVFVSDDVDAVVAAVDAPGATAVAAAEALINISTFDVVVVSPGVPSAHPIVEAAQSVGVPVVGELELAFHYTSARIVGVTGTNGKSTTVGVIGCILEAAGFDAVVAGNVGTPLSQILLDRQPEVLVLEVSSFQLDTIDTARFDVAVLLNITPDHLDRYDHSMDIYAASKSRILNHANERTLYVYNADDPRASSFVDRNPGTSISFSTRTVNGTGVCIENDTFVIYHGGKRREVAARSDFAPVGIHNAENAMAAIATVTAFNVSAEAIRVALQRYRALPHRMEVIRNVDGVRYINDSKATNVDAAVKSIESIDGNVIVILGGRDKEGDFSRLAPLRSRVRAAVLIGEASDRIREVLNGGWTFLDASDMDHAVERARAAARSGDTVLLAPACASFDMFQNFEHRGDVFRACVSAMQGGDA